MENDKYYQPEFADFLESILEEFKIVKQNRLDCYVWIRICKGVNLAGEFVSNNVWIEYCPKEPANLSGYGSEGLNIDKFQLEKLYQKFISKNRKDKLKIIEQDE